jgi:uncharacterized membrane protein
MAFGLCWLSAIGDNDPARKRRKKSIRVKESQMFDIDHLLRLGVFSQLIPVWQVFFFIASLLPFLLLNRVKICLLVTYLFTFYLGFMVQWGDYIASMGSMEPFVIYSFSGLAIAVFFVATFFTEAPEKTKLRWFRFARPAGQEDSISARHGDPIDMAVNITNISDADAR